MDGIGGVAQEKHLLDAADGTGDLPLIQTDNTLRGETPILHYMTAGHGYVHIVRTLFRVSLFTCLRFNTSSS